MPGRHKGADLHKWGHIRMRAVLCQEAFPARFRGAPLAAQMSSLGLLNERWLVREFRYSLAAGLCEGGTGEEQVLDPRCKGAGMGAC